MDERVEKIFNADTSLNDDSGGYLIPEVIEVDESSSLRKLLSKVGLMQRKYKEVNLFDELIASVEDGEINTDNSEIPDTVESVWLQLKEG